MNPAKELRAVLEDLRAIDVVPRIDDGAVYLRTTRGELVLTVERVAGEDLVQTLRRAGMSLARQSLECMAELAPAAGGVA